MTGLSDSFQRPINYLRISVTDRCNLRCIYCMPVEGINLMAHHDILSYEEIELVARAAAELGINKLRLTGGEPLLRPELSKLVEALARVEGIEDISLTTNGVLLKKYAAELKQAGLHRVNVSLDSLRSDRFHIITRVGKLGEVLEGIDAARQVGLDPVKINTVAIRGLNDDEVLDFARRTIDQEWHVRFIELMPFSEDGKDNHSFIAASEIRQRVESLGKLDTVRSGDGGPAKYFSLAGALGTIGFISPISDHFCSECNRLRLTAEGKLRSCLFSDEEIDLKKPLREGATLVDLKLLIRGAALCKPEGHKIIAGIVCERSMAQIGG
ncbi:GTP 3',8-cyclase MoaA [Chloroflexota bacterium]